MLRISYLLSYSVRFGPLNSCFEQVIFADNNSYSRLFSVIVYPMSQYFSRPNKFLLLLDSQGHDLLFVHDCINNVLRSIQERQISVVVSLHVLVLPRAMVLK